MEFTEKQRAVLEEVKRDANRSIAEICASANVAESSYFRWMNESVEFRQAYRDCWLEIVDRALPSISVAMALKARKGDVQAARLVADMAGILRQRVEHSAASGLADLVAASLLPAQPIALPARVIDAEAVISAPAAPPLDAPKASDTAGNGADSGASGTADAGAAK